MGRAVPGHGHRPGRSGPCCGLLDAAGAGGTKPSAPSEAPLGLWLCLVEGGSRSRPGWGHELTLRDAVSVLLTPAHVFATWLTC